MASQMVKGGTAERCVSAIRIGNCLIILPRVETVVACL